MKKLKQLFATMLLALVLVVNTPAVAQTGGGATGGTTYGTGTTETEDDDNGFTWGLLGLIGLAGLLPRKKNKHDDDRRTTTTNR